jgi:hypothetical protein
MKLRTVLSLSSVIAAIVVAALAWRLIPGPMPSLRAVPPAGEACRLTLTGKPLVLLALGQSNAANSGPRRFAARDDGVLVWSGGFCRRASDPLPGGSGKGGSVWIPLAEALARRSGRQVVLAVLAADGTAVRHWLDPHNALPGALSATLEGLRRDGLPPELVFWLQGEADLRDATPAPLYAQELRQILARVHSAAPAAKIWIAKASRCRNEGSAALRAAQGEVAAALDYARPGPDLDRFGDGFRRDGCHFNETGQRAVADAWLASLAKDW